MGTFIDDERGFRGLQAHSDGNYLLKILCLLLEVMSIYLVN
jgi:hypothetical protein